MIGLDSFSVLCQGMLGKVTLRIGKYNVSARREPFPVMLSKGLSWIPQVAAIWWQHGFFNDPVAAWVFL